MNKEECSERIRLVDEYSRSAAEYSRQLDLLKNSTGGQNPQATYVVETARLDSQRAWIALAQHISEHRCLPLVLMDTTPVSEPAGGQSLRDPHLVLGKAAVAAPDVILVANDERRYVDVNDAAAEVLGGSREQIAGRLVEEYFSPVRGETFEEAWDTFIADGVQYGICQLVSTSQRFEYRAKANFAPGLHLAVLREIKDRTP